MKEAKTDVAVLILFFNRPHLLKQLFEEVRKARPSKLFLYQDGPRHDADKPAMEACREIVSNIDWQCEVHRKYQDKNYGCDPSNYMAQKWAFSIIDKCIVFEDDDVPSQSFFPFCKEMLDRYENDPRVTLISGFNATEECKDVPDDYFFTSVFSIWGWASWRRVVNQWEGDYAFLDDEYSMRQMEKVVKSRKLRSDIINMMHDHRQTGKAYYESIFWAYMLLNSGLAIMPTKNMITNNGAVGDSTHYVPLKTMPKGLRRMFTMKRFEMDFPLRHPHYVIENVEFKEAVYRINAWGHPWIKMGRAVEELWLNVRYGQFGQIAKAMKRRLKKWMGKEKHV